MVSGDVPDELPPPLPATTIAPAPANPALTPTNGNTNPNSVAGNSSKYIQPSFALLK